jgi:diguanylate cyclase (GGDEF)-like protein
MKLSRLLVGVISFLWVLVFIATLVIVIKSTQDYLERAMESHAQDAATALGLSITHSATIKDVATIETMANAVFDRGYYREILVKGTKGETIVSKKVDEAVMGVPRWFIRNLPLATPRMNATVMDGWRQVALVEVVSHAGHAYAELWRVSVRSAWVLLVVGVASLIVVLAVLRLALKPLGAMEQQALDVARRRFTVLEKLPWAQELQRIAVALNTMCLAVERMLTEATDLAERMRRTAYVDAITGLMNRNDFSERLGHLIGAPTKFPAGALALVRLRGFIEFNQRNGRAEGDALLKTAAQALGAICGQHPGSLLARLDGPEFALLLPEFPERDLPQLGDRLVAALAPIEGFPRSDSSLMAHVGLAHYRYHEGASFGELMAAAASAVEVAQGAGVPGWRVYEDGGARESAAALSTQINTLLRGGVPRERVHIQRQPVRACHAAEATWRYRSETVVRIVAEDGSLIRAGLFIAAAKRLGVLDQLDRVVIEMVIEHMIANGPVLGGATAVNLSQDSLVNAGFMNWLEGVLASRPEVAGNLIVEVAETSIIHSLEAARGAFDRLRRIGVQCSIDRFGQSTASVGYLRSLNVDYIKIDGSYTRGIASSSDKQFLVQALVGIAHGLGIQAITEYVESQEDFDVMKSLAVDGVQGYFIGKPG